MDDRITAILKEIIPLLTNEKCKEILNIISDIDMDVSYMDYTDWERFCDDGECDEYVKEIADMLNKIFEGR